MYSRKNYQWKGNVRELENCIERSIILCDGDIITPEHVSMNRQISYESTIGRIPMDGSLEDAAGEATKIVETDRISRALRETKGNKSKASEILKVSYKTLLNKIKEYGIDA
jgi:two-component system response regulator AtoC